MYTIEEVRSKWEPLDTTQGAPNRHFFRSSNEAVIEIHPKVVSIGGTAKIDNFVYLKEAVVLEKNVIVKKGAIIDCGTRVEAQAVIGAWAQIGAACFIGHNSIIGNSAQVDDRVFIGANVIVEPNVRISEKMKIESGTHVTRTPTYIIGSTGDPICWASPSEIMIGCKIHSVEYWQRHYEGIALQNYYTEKEIDEYLTYFNLLLRQGSPFSYTLNRAPRRKYSI